MINAAFGVWFLSLAWIKYILCTCLWSKHSSFISLPCGSRSLQIPRQLSAFSVWVCRDLILYICPSEKYILVERAKDHFFSLRWWNIRRNQWKDSRLDLSTWCKGAVLHDRPGMEVEREVSCYCLRQTEKKVCTLQFFPFLKLQTVLFRFRQLDTN